MGLLLLWFLAGFMTWIVMRVRMGELYVGDIMLGALVGIPGPTLPLILAAWYVGVFLERFARILIWERKSPKLPEPSVTQA